MANEALRSAPFTLAEPGTSFDPAMRASQPRSRSPELTSRYGFEFELKLQAGRWRQYNANLTREDLDKRL